MLGETQNQFSLTGARLSTCGHAKDQIPISSVMKTKLSSFFIMLALLSGSNYGAAQSTRFFRIAGPAATTITAIRADGSLVWSNALAGTNYTVQMATSLGGGANWVDYVQLPVISGVNTNWLFDPNPPAGMSLIPAGAFQMGDAIDGNAAGDAPVHTVYVSAFYMDQTDVTLAQWQRVYNWATNHGYTFVEPGSGWAANYPVETIAWDDAINWCNARSEMEGRTPAYYRDATLTAVCRTGGSGYGIYNACLKWNAGYRLPTEAEWEKAARGGLNGQRYPWGDTTSWGQANYYGNPLHIWADPWSGQLYTNGYAYDYSTPQNTADEDYDPAFSHGDSQAFWPYTSPVDYFAPNGYGLYDMTGNVWQWCWDWYTATAYTTGSSSDPHGPVADPSWGSHVCRGGSFWMTANYCTVACRLQRGGPNSYSSNIGFRTVLPLGQ